MKLLFPLGLLSALLIPASADDLADDAFARIVAPGETVKQLATGFGFTEGPVWNPRGFWVFSDQQTDELHKVTPEGKTALVRKPTSHSNGNTYDNAGALVSCEQNPERRVARKKADGSFETVADRYEGKRFNSPNDLVVKSDGSIYFTDPTYGAPRSGRELDFRGLYRVLPDGKVELLDKEWDQPNGVTLSPDEKTLYVADSGSGNVFYYDVAPDGTLSNKTLLAAILKPGAPDGLKTDAEGHVLVAGPGAIWIFSARGGLLGKIPVPEEPANLAFGGSDGKTLMITARHSVFSVKLKVGGKTGKKMALREVVAPK